MNSLELKLGFWKFLGLVRGVLVSLGKVYWIGVLLMWGGIGLRQGVGSGEWTYGLELAGLGLIVVSIYRSYRRRSQ